IATARRTSIALDSIQLIGMHGQTIFHEGSPARFLGRKIASTLQIGEAAVVAERTGIPVISNFRERDIAAGGQGAPLVPFVDQLLFRDRRRTRVALNIGGIANITVLPPKSSQAPVIAFDTGPGNMIVDALVEHHTKGRQLYDRDGRIAERAHIDSRLLDSLLRPRPASRSLGREQFGREFVARLLSTGIPLPDLIATATEFTAQSTALAIRNSANGVSEIIASGGGIHNRRLMRRLAALLPGVQLSTTADYGIDPDAKEAIAFAILACEFARSRPANFPSATGARKSVVLGKLSP
ncbi:MAG TPA: anhydro-N-acetylmuramic acid kinase, partial [Bryobacteraceae bacterium]|nr:anhydro-N-acetylmuramic acid kinase [Bryobacteraceae bacterium]